ncbi:MAG TPA: hypothetical protein VND92_10390 [Vicinamibacterales bacterium]|nr:hypothetical protein [Vicinamibacterales bacterium]
MTGFIVKEGSDPMKKLNSLMMGGVLAAAMLVAPSAMAASLTGVVSDSNCGAHHHIANATACTRACVKKGASYALVVGDKVYTLKASKKATAELYKLAGKDAAVSGAVKGTTVEVKSVKPAK